MKLVTQSSPEIEKKEAQIRYCTSRNIPFFALDQCPSCGLSIWRAVTADEATYQHVTNCPICRHSFCE